MNSGTYDDPLGEAKLRIAAGDASGAVEFLKAQLHAGRGGLLTRIALGRALLAAGNREEALPVFRAAVALCPGIAVAGLALGDRVLVIGAFAPAIVEVLLSL